MLTEIQVEKMFETKCKIKREYQQIINDFCPEDAGLKEFCEINCAKCWLKAREV